MRSFAPALAQPLALGLLVACSGPAPSPSGADMARPAPDLAFKSNCGRPGDTGNALGVGKFCQRLADCTMNTQATLCTTLGDDENFFCTFACSKNGPANQCGDDARCACSGGGCGCFPTRCDGPSDGGAPGG